MVLCIRYAMSGREVGVCSYAGAKRSQVPTYGGLLPGGSGRTALHTRYCTPLPPYARDVLPPYTLAMLPPYTLTTFLHAMPPFYPPPSPRTRCTTSLHTRPYAVPPLHTHATTSLRKRHTTFLRTRCTSSL